MKRTIQMCTMLGLMLVVSGCLTSITAETKKTAPDGSVTTAKVRVFGTGDKVAQSAAEGLFADGTDEDLGAGVKKASAKQESSGIEGSLKGMGEFMGGMAQFALAMKQLQDPTATAKSLAPVTPVVAAQPSEPDASTIVSLPSANTTVNSGPLNAKIAEAKATGKPLVVLAGIPGCGYCTQMDAIIAGSPAFLARTDIVFYSENAPISSNAAAQWTGGGNAPVLRVTHWDAAGKVACDVKVERPKTIADIESALGGCKLTN